MDFNLIVISNSLLDKQAVDEIIKCNDVTACYGLKLSKEQALELVNTRTDALKCNGRIEFGGGIIDKLIIEFCNSPFISQDNYEAVIHDLIDIFYYFKNESEDEISDDELISLMKKYFDENCKGCIELLENRELEILAHNIRYGIDAYSDIEEYSREEYYEYYEEDGRYE